MGETYILKKILENGFNVVGVVEPGKTAAKGKNLKHSLRNILRPDLMSIATRAHIDYLHFTRKEYERFESFIASHNPDIVVVKSMPFLIKESTLSLARCGFINVHSAFLPCYRGPNPFVYQFLELKDRIGYTIHFIDEGEDTGDILYQDYLSLADESFRDIYKRLLENSSEKLVQLLSELEAGNELPLKSQPAKSPTTRGRRVKDAWPLIDFEQITSKELYRFFKRAQPWLPRIDGYTVEKYVVDPLSKPSGKIENSASSMFVYTNDGYVILKKKGFIRRSIDNIKRLL